MKKGNKGIIAVLVIIIVVLLVLVVLLGTGKVSFKSNTEEPKTSEKKETNDNKQKSSVDTSKILSYYKDMISDVADSKHQYSVVDINNDDIPELLLYVTGTLGNEIVADTSVFTYDENKGDKANNYVVYVGNITGRIDNNTVLYKMNDGRLLSVFGHMGYEIATYFKLENDWLIRTEFKSRQTDEYISGDNEIKFKSCKDTSLIDNYGKKK